MTGGNIDGGKAVQWNNDKVDHFKWLLQDAGNDYFYLVVKQSGKVLNVEGYSTGDGAAITQRDNKGTDNQKWRFEAV